MTFGTVLRICYAYLILIEKFQIGKSSGYHLRLALLLFDSVSDLPLNWGLIFSCAVASDLDQLTLVLSTGAAAAVWWGSETSTPDQNCLICTSHKFFSVGFFVPVSLSWFFSLPLVG